MSDYAIRSNVYRWVRQMALSNSDEGIEGPIVFGDAVLSFLVKVGLKSLFFKGALPQDKAVKLYDLTFPSPIIFSSFKSELEVLEIWLSLGIGGGIIKTIMTYPRVGNPKPRIQEVFIQEVPCLVNAMGLPGPGIEGFLKKLHKSGVFSYQRPIGISLGGANAEEYKEVAQAVLSDAFLKDKPYFFEINASCPNTDDGQDMLKNPALIASLLTELRQLTDRVIGVKLSPDQSNDALLKCAQAIASVERTYINVGNTQFKSCEALHLPKNALSRGGGGLSGPVLFERTLEMVKVVHPVGCPIMATGGVDTAEKVRLLQEAGATLVGMATALVQDPYCIPWINSTL